MLNRLGNALFQRGLLDTEERRAALLDEALRMFLQALEYDPENLAAHYGLSRVYADLGDDEASGRHSGLHARYKPDDNARDYAVARARIKYPAANRAAEAVVIYELSRSLSHDVAEHAAMRRIDE